MKSPVAGSSRRWSEQMGSWKDPVPGRSGRLQRWWGVDSGSHRLEDPAQQSIFVEDDDRRSIDGCLAAHEFSPDGSCLRKRANVLVEQRSDPGGPIDLDGKFQFSPAKNDRLAAVSSSLEAESPIERNQAEDFAVQIQSAEQGLRRVWKRGHRARAGDLPRDLGREGKGCLLYTSPSPRDVEESRMPSSA